MSLKKGIKRGINDSMLSVLKKKNSCTIGWKIIKEGSTKGLYRVKHCVSYDL